MKTLLVLGAALSLAMPVHAAISAKEAERLGKDLTPVGAEKAGNGRDIPAWTGGMAQDKTHVPGEFHKDPFAAEKRLMRIDASNMEQHKDRLTDGQMALLKRFPEFYFEVYPTHRTASYPKYVYDAIKTNATRAELMQYGSGVSGATMSSPFPIPKNGLEVLWNHTLRFRGHSLNYTAVASSVTQGGQRMDALREYSYFFQYSMPNAAPEDLDNKIFFLKRKTLAPAQLAGSITLVHETLDQVQSPRKSWIYVPGQRRLRRTPDLAYDTADINTNSIRTVDQVDMFNGAPDYYEWELKGKREIYIPYNTYAVHQGNLKVDDILQKHHINPAYLRYEAHRVWEVEAKIRVGYSHRYATRRYYVDEDSWSIVYAEEYDEKGGLWQVTEAHTVNYAEIPLVYTTLEVTYDLESGRYYAEGLDNERGATLNFSKSLSEDDFSPNAIRREAVR